MVKKFFETKENNPLLLTSDVRPTFLTINDDSSSDEEPQNHPSFVYIKISLLRSTEVGLYTLSLSPDVLKMYRSKFNVFISQSLRVLYHFRLIG